MKQVFSGITYFYNQSDSRNQVEFAEGEFDELFDAKVLLEAVKVALVDFPFFKKKYQVINNNLYEDYNDKEPVIWTDDAEPVMGEATNDYWFVVSARGKRMGVYFKRSIADGHGISPFAIDIVCRYYQLIGREDVDVQSCISAILDTHPSDRMDMEPFESPVFLEHEKKQDRDPISWYQLPTINNERRVRIIKLDADSFLEKSKKYRVKPYCVVSCLVADLIRKEQAKSGDSSPIGVYIPIDMRNTLRVKGTLNECLSYVVVPYDTASEDFESRLVDFQRTMMHSLKKDVFLDNMKYDYETKKFLLRDHLSVERKQNMMARIMEATKIDRGTFTMSYIPLGDEESLPFARCIQDVLIQMKEVDFGMLFEMCQVGKYIYLNVNYQVEQEAMVDELQGLLNAL